MERIIEARLRDGVEISKQQYGFMPGKGTTDAIFALRMLMEKYREEYTKYRIHKASHIVYSVTIKKLFKMKTFFCISIVLNYCAYVR